MRMRPKMGVFLKVPSVFFFLSALFGYSMAVRNQVFVTELELMVSRYRTSKSPRSPIPQSHPPNHHLDKLFYAKI